MCYADNEKGKRQITEGKELPIQERIRTHGEKENCTYLEIFEADTIKQAETKKKKRLRKEYLRRTGKLLEIKSYKKNLIKGINTGTVPLI